MSAPSNRGFLPPTVKTETVIVSREERRQQEAREGRAAGWTGAVIVIFMIYCYAKGIA